MSTRSFKPVKTLFAIGLKTMSVLMVLSMLLANIGILPTQAAATVTISGSAGVAGATITANGDWGYDDNTATSDSSGNYTVTLDTPSSRWSGTVTPSKTGYTFSPTSRSYNRITTNQTGQNYTATLNTYTISGSVGTAGGGATMTYTGGSTTANSSGAYSFSVTYGWSGTVTPTKTGYTFSPVNRSYPNVTSNQTNQNYTATQDGYTISGNAGANSVTITYTGGTTTTNSSGNYSFFVLPGWSGTVTPSKSGLSFSPASRTYSNVSANQTDQNYTPRPTSFLFASMGDAGGQSTYFTTTASQIAALSPAPALVLYNGDLEANGVSTTEMNTMVGILKSTGLFNKTFLVRGNEDSHLAGSAASWETYFETPANTPTRPQYVVNRAALDSSSDYLAYSFDYGNSIFIGLDVPGDIGGAGGSQNLTDAELTFLDQRLTYAENAGLTHAFIFFHGPEYPITSAHSTCALRADDSCTPPALITIINNHPIVSAIFHGHEHILGWVHMDGTRVSDLTRSYEEFFSSPAGDSNYNDLIYPDRVDYYYPDLTSSDFGFATISVNGLSFTYKIYKVGTTSSVWSHTFSKVNTPPTISDIADQTTNEDTATGAIPFTVGDADSSLDYLTVTATSSNTTLVPEGNITLGGSGASRTINILPGLNQSGSATITVSVNDGNVTVSDTFTLTVTAVNDPPTADPQSVSMPWNSTLNIVLTGSDIESDPLTFSIMDGPAHGGLSGTGANQAYTPAADYSGTDSFTFRAYDGALYSAPATVSINVTAYSISGNAGVAGATLSYTDGTPKTATADGSGLYSFQVPTGWSGTVIPSKAGYIFTPASMTYVNVQADQTSQNYSTEIIMLTISGNAGIAGTTLSYTDGTPKTATADEAGIYSFQVPYGWSGTVTPSSTGYDFIPAARSYTTVTVDQSSQDYTTTTARVWYVDKTRTCTDTGQVGSFASPFCTISRGAYLAQPGQIVHVLHGTYAETVYPERSGTAGSPISYIADPGVVVTGRPYAPPVPPSTLGTNYPGFGVSGKSYIVIDGFTFDSTSQQGIYVDASDHITLINNHVTRAGISSAPLPEGHPYTQGIYLRNTSYSTISNNITDHNTCIGIRVVGGGYNLISKNVSTENFSVVETDAAGIELTGSSHNTVINNLVYSNEDSGINLYYWDTNASGATYNIVVGNLSYENGDHGIDNYQSPNNWIIGNTIQGNGTAGINLEGGAGKGSFGATIENNILSQNGTTPPSGSWGGNLRFDTESISGAITDYNLFYRTTATVQIIWNNLPYTNLAAFKTAVPTQEVHGLEGNPLFVNPVAPVLRQTGVPYVGLGILGNYYPSVGAPEIDSANADAPNEQALDIDGNSRIDDLGTPNTGAGVRTYDDRGAYEYLPAGPSLPIVTTQACTNIMTTTATGNGTIAATGLPNPTQHGVVWSTSSNPTTADSKTVDGPVSAPGAFTSSITGLLPGSIYHVRAYATNTEGTAYGDDVTCTTVPALAVTTQAVTNITTTGAIGHGTITALGIPNPTHHGMVWNTSGTPTIADSKTDEGAVSATGAFASTMAGLTPGTLYYLRAYATNAEGTAYGDEVTFTSLIEPTVTTQAVTSILPTTAVGNGNIVSLGVPNPTQHGVVWNTSGGPTITDSKTTDGPVSVTGAFTSSMTGLAPNTHYYLRAYATNTAGTAYGDVVEFTTLLAPTLTTEAVTDINSTTATCNGTVTVLGSSNPTEHGCVWSTSANPTTADSKTTDGAVSAIGAFTSSMAGLSQGTLYHVRAYATNAAGTAYGEDVTFTTWILPTVTTEAVTNITQSTAMGNGTIVGLGVPNPTQYGVVWDINPNPSVALTTKTENGPASVTGPFISNFTGLALGQTYHLRAYATNAFGTAYGDDVTFTTLPSVSTTTTPAEDPAAAADVAYGSTTGVWINPSYIYADDTNYAQVTLSGATSHYLEGTNYGFAIPANAVINGIRVTIGRYESGLDIGNDVRDVVVSLMKNSALVGNNKAAGSTEWPTGGAPVERAYGANNDLWGTSWTAADINASGFGVALSVSSSNNRIAYVDYIKISVTYTVTMFSSTTSVTCGPAITYGSNVACVATVARGSGPQTPTGSVTWDAGGNGSFTTPCTLSGTGGTATCSVTYTPSTVGSGSHSITASYAGDANFYSSVSTPVTQLVNPKGLTITGLTAENKIYDGSLTATLSGTPLPSGVVDSDVVSITGTPTASFADKNIGTGKAVTVSGYTLAGANAANYTLTQPAGLTANITAKGLTITGLTADNKIYDGNVTAALSGTPVLTGVVSPDVVDLTGTASAAFADKNVGTGKVVTVSGYTLGGTGASNYSLSQPSGLTANITAKGLTITGLTAENKIYDGNITATLSGTPVLNGIVSPDVVDLTGTASAAFADKNVGTGKAVTVIGYTLGGAGASNYTLTQPAGLTANITAKGLTITGLTAENKVYDGNLTTTLSGTPLPGGVVSGDVVTITGTPTASFADKNVGTGKAVSVIGYTLGGAGASNYTVSQPTGLIANITAKGLTITGLTAENKIYDGNVNATLSGTPVLNGAVSGDLISLTGTPTATFADKNVGTAKAVTVSGYGLTGADSGNYSLSQPTGLAANITTKGLTITGLTAENKIYDGGVNATLSGTPLLNGIVGSDEVNLAGTPTATFGDKNVGTGKAVAVIGYSLTGAGASDYALTQPTGLTANITAKGLTITGLTADNKIYDGSVTAALSGTPVLTGIVSPDVVNLTGIPTASFADKNVGTAKAVTVSGYTLGGAGASNYSLSQPSGLTANITAKGLTVTGLTADSKVYDGNVTATLSGTPLPSGVVSGDVVTIAGTPTAAFADKNVGTAKVVTVSGYTLGGTGASNYSLTQPTGLTANITAKGLTITGLTAENKIYNGNVTATLSGTAVLNGVVSPDVVNLTGTATATFANKNVGTGKAVTVIGYALGGAGASNYSLSQPSGLTANITAKGLTITGLTADNKVYDGNVNATLSGTAVLNGVVSPDVVNLTGTATASFADKNIGTAKAVTVVGYGLTGGDASNYSLSQPSGLTANITAKGLTITGLTADLKVYDGTVVATLSGTPLPSGVVGGDVVTIAGTPTATFADKNVGTGKAVTVSGYTLGGAGASNYTLSQPTGLTANILPLAVIISPTAGQSKAYGQAEPLPFTYTHSGLIGIDAISGALGRDPGENAGQYAFTLASLNAGSNYTLVMSGSAEKFTITKADQTITFATLPNKAVSDPDFTVTATASSGLSVTFSSTSTACNVTSVGLVHIVSTGTCAIKADQGGSTNYNAAPQVQRSFEIVLNLSTTTLVSSASPVTYGTKVTLTATVTAGASGDVEFYDGAGLLGTATLDEASPNHAVLSNVLLNAAASPHSLTAKYLGDASHAGSTSTAVSQVVNKAALSVTANNDSKTYNGLAYHGGNDVAYAGFVNGEGASALGGSLSFTTGSSEGAINAGSYDLVPSGLTSGNYTITYHNGTLTVNKAALSVTADNKSKTYNGLVYSGGYTVTYNAFVNGESASDLGGTLAFGGTSQTAVNVGTYPIVPSGLTSVNYAISFHDGTLTISKADQTITFGALADKPVNAPDFTVTATASSGLSVTFSSTSTACNVTSVGLVHIVSTGACAIKADQAGNPNYNQAPQVQRSFNIAKVDQTISFTSTAPSDASVGGATYTVGATTTSGLTVSFSIDPTTSLVCSVTGSVVTFNTVGTCKINANQGGNGTYNPAPMMQQPVTVAKGSQTIHFTSTLPTNPSIGGTYTPTATSTSGLPVTIDLDSSSSGICTMSSGVVHFIGNGTCTVNATQAGDDNYNAASQVQQSIEVGKLDQTITFTSTPPANPKTGGTYTPTATASSGLEVTFEIDASSGTVCTISSGLVTFNADGVCKVNAIQAGNDTYNPAPMVQQTIIISLYKVYLPIVLR